MKTQPIFAARFRWATPAAALLLLGLASPASAHRMEKHFTVSERPIITIRNSQGRIEVKSWKKPEVVVIGNHNSNKVEVDTEMAGNRIEVNTHLLTEDITADELQADYQITVPEESELQVKTDSGSVVVERVYGDMTFETVAADLQLQEVAGYLVIRTIRGSVICSRCIGKIDVRSISGNVRLLQPLMENVQARTTKGNIYFDGEFRPRGIYNLHSDYGLVEVRFSESDSFDLSATSVQGTIENQAKVKPDPHGSVRLPSRFKKGLFGTLNDGHAKVDLSSYSGTIRILKRD